MRPMCEREHEVLRAVAAGVLPPELRGHVDSCASCADVVLVARALREEAAVAVRDPLPDPAGIWRTARREERAAIARRATRPVTLMVWTAAGICALSAVVAVAWFWPAIADQATVVSGWFSPRTAIDAGQILTAVLGFASLAAFVAAFALFESWAREER